MALNKKALTILFLESSKNFGGQERRLVHEAVLLKARGHTPLIACPQDAELSNRAADAGLVVYPVSMSNAGQPGSILQLCSVVRNNSVDILYSHSSKDSTMAGLVAIFTRKPLVRSRELLNPVKKAMSYNVFPKRILACSGAVREHLIAAGVNPDKIHVQYPPIAVARYQSADALEKQSNANDLGLTGHYPVISCVAGFRMEKRQEDIIRALPRIRDVLPKAMLVLPGSGWYANNLKEIAAAVGVQDMVNFPGEREDVPALLANTDVFVLPSSSEPFGMSPVEAMAAGVPVVVTRTGGLAEIVTHEVDGLHVPVRDPASIAEAVIRICQDKILRDRLIAAGRIRAQDFDEAKAVAGLEKHFREVLS